MLKVENYTKENLQECIEFLDAEISRVKENLDNSGYIKYSPMGILVREYRNKLKRLREDMREDLIEDFER